MEIAGNSCETIPAFLAAINRLSLNGLIVLNSSNGNSEFWASLQPHSEFFQLEPRVVDPEQIYKMSRFAYLRLDESGKSVLSSPKAYSKMIMHHKIAFDIAYYLQKGVSIFSLIHTHGVDPTDELELYSLFSLLLMAEIIEDINSSENETMNQWEFHDLLMQSKCRLGRNDKEIGGLFQFKGIIAPRPAVKPMPPHIRRIQLKKPTSEEIRWHDAGLEETLLNRASVRTQSPVPITKDQLGQLFYRTARVISQYSVPGIGEFTKRPYPNGGASYELEIYLTVNHCLDLERGFYYYDPVFHDLLLIRTPCDDMEKMIYESWMSSGRTCHTQMLITIASRFQRVSWKYKGMALATQFKNVGVLFAHLYLVATAMRLAPSALGLGNSDRFNRLSGTSYYEESSIGEFVIGSKY